MGIFIVFKDDYLQGLLAFKWRPLHAQRHLTVQEMNHVYQRESMVKSSFYSISMGWAASVADLDDIYLHRLIELGLILAAKPQIRNPNCLNEVEIAIVFRMLK